MWAPDRLEQHHAIETCDCPKCGGTGKSYLWFKPAFNGQDIEDETGRKWVEVSAEDFEKNNVVDGVDGLIETCPLCEGNGVVAEEDLYQGSEFQGLEAYDELD